MNNKLRDISNLIAKNYNIKIIFDIGANRGEWTRYYARIFKGADFYMFEGNPSLKKPNIFHEWYNVLLSDLDNKEVLFHSINNTGDSYYKEQTRFYSGKHQTKKLLSRTLDSFIDEQNIPLPDFIKIDTQGSEVDIFRGASNCLNNCKIVLSEAPIIEYNKGAPKLYEYIDMMRHFSFVPVGIEDIHIIDHTLVQIDIIFIKKSIKDRIFGGGQFICQHLIDNIQESKPLQLG